MVPYKPLRLSQGLLPSAPSSKGTILWPAFKGAVIGAFAVAAAGTMVGTKGMKSLAKEAGVGAAAGALFGAVLWYFTPESTL